MVLRAEVQHMALREFDDLAENRERALKLQLHLRGGRGRQSRGLRRCTRAGEALTWRRRERGPRPFIPDARIRQYEGGEISPIALQVDKTGLRGDLIVYAHEKNGDQMPRPQITGTVAESSHFNITEIRKCRFPCEARAP